MQAIGQLAAGVAHEINTPTQFVGSNLRFLRSGLERILALLDRYQDLTAAVRQGQATPEMASELDRATADAHLEFFAQEAPTALEQSLDGIERISRIVAALRDFSHPGSEKKELADLNRILTSVLSVSRGEWKHVAEIHQDLDPHLPHVECLPGELSQAFLNIIINAVHAIQDANRSSPTAEGQVQGLITLSTHSNSTGVEVRISDNGAGIPLEIRDRIFDPFFTTKEVGRGTGQGLAIVYNAVTKKHGGTVDFESEVGRGTSFIIRIPFHQPPLMNLSEESESQP